ncbi:MAG: prepilin-type N-terminal cleavage/methylation domain-containing protein [Candidatus Riflebacteria bacterium]|nr:prepilin-type N-terminal cleavage/methylation domain-containing protein [Candidatus Riflebacteria bacterium]
MRHARGGRRGFTAVEVTIVMLIMAVIIAGLYRFLAFGSRSVSLGSEEIEGVRRANVVLERIKRDLRSICDVVKVNAGGPEVQPGGKGLTFLRFVQDASSPVPLAQKVRYRTEKVQVQRAGKPADAVRLQILYGKGKTPVVSEDSFTDVRFKKYRLNGKPFYQVRLAVADLTAPSGQTHVLQTSLGSRYYHTFLDDLSWLALDETAFSTRIPSVK